MFCTEKEFENQAEKRKWVSSLTEAQLIDYLITELEEDTSVCRFLSAISACAITSKEDAIYIVRKDEDCLEWARKTLELIP